MLCWAHSCCQGEEEAEVADGEGAEEEAAEEELYKRAMLYSEPVVPNIEFAT